MQKIKKIKKYSFVKCSFFQPQLDVISSNIRMKTGRS